MLGPETIAVQLLRGSLELKIKQQRPMSTDYSNQSTNTENPKEQIQHVNQLQFIHRLTEALDDWL